jgi:hypothetical protein
MAISDCVVNQKDTDSGAGLCRVQLRARETRIELTYPSKSPACHNANWDEAFREKNSQFR